MGKGKSAVRNKFCVGDVVEWTSQANGSHKKKIGKVIEVVAANSTPRHREFGFPGFRGRPHESYIVEVTYPAKTSTSAIKKVTRRKPRHYWPVASLLRKSRYRTVPA